MPTAPGNYAIFMSPLPKNRPRRTFEELSAVAIRILHNYQVLLDDGNRIIIPQGYFKILHFEE